MSDIKYTYYLNGSVDEKIYYKNGIIHREDGPAIIEYYPEGEIRSETYFMNGNRHRSDDLPAKLWYGRKGNIREKVYYKNGKMHRVYGPSIIEYFGSGDIRYNMWHYNNEEYIEEVYEWIDENNFKSWQDMKEEDYDRMWMEIL